MLARAALAAGSPLPPAWRAARLLSTPPLPRFAPRPMAAALAAAGEEDPNGSAAAAASAAAPTPPRIAFATGNEKKLREVVAILAAGRPLPFAVDAVALDLPELQGEPEEIARAKCAAAAAAVGGAAMVEDTCLCFDALGGLPGERGPALGRTAESGTRASTPNAAQTNRPATRPPAHLPARPPAHPPRAACARRPLHQVVPGEAGPRGAQQAAGGV
jgi:hypothetical protein